MVHDVSVHELHAEIQGGTSLAVVDVREPTETASGIIEGALLYPWISGVLRREHESLPEGVPLYVICASGGRSSPAASFLAGAGHTCVHNVLGGMNAWKAAGYPTTGP
ncbi:MAG: rhodanese-like domain-containing protein [Deltaproteobacteria bacterium]|nr:rhodanese-like domain-containing protein [Deltaproteobacteria bacterium]